MYANVILHDQQFVTHIGVVGVGKLAAATSTMALLTSGTTWTNINGFFRFDSVDTGGYLVEINDHDTLGAVLPARVNPKDTLVVVSGTLTHCGTITGNIDTSQLHGSQVKGVYVPELGRLVSVDSAGNFTIPNLPAWNYHLRFVVGDTFATLPTDSVPVQVTSGGTSKVFNLGADTGSTITQSNVAILFCSGDIDSSTNQICEMKPDGKWLKRRSIPLLQSYRFS